MSPGFAPVQLRSHRYFILKNIVLCKPNPFWPNNGKRHPTRRSRRHTTDKYIHLSWGESQSVLSSRMCPSGWTYRSALPGKQTKTCASHGVSYRASSLAGCVLLDGPTGHADKAHRCSKYKPYNGWILQWSRPLLQGNRQSVLSSRMCPSGWTYWSRRQGTDAVVTTARSKTQQGTEGCVVN